MLEKLKGKMQQYEQVAREKSDEIERKIRAKFDDPIAQQAQWHHLNKGSGSSSQGQKIASVAGDRLRVVNTLGGLTIPLLAAFGGLALVWIAFDSHFNIVTKGTEPISTAAFVFLTAVGVLFTGPAFWMLRPRNTLTFDRTAGCFWRGRGKPTGDSGEKGPFPLDRIAGVQIPPRKHVHFRNNNKDRSFYSYELNLILEDNERINLLDHGNLVEIRNDGKKLSQYLGKPLFDASL